MDRYSQIKEKLKFANKENIDIKLAEEPKKMISVYEQNTDLFISHTDKKSQEFFSLLEKYDDYGNMIVVQKAQNVIDSFEPVIWNYQAHIEYLYGVLREMAGTKAKEEKIEDIKKKTSKELTMETVLMLKNKGFSVRKIADQLKVSHMQVQRLIEKSEKKELLQESEENDTENDNLQ